MYIHIVNQSPELFSSRKTKTLHPSNINSLSSLPHIPATTILHSVAMNAVSLLSHSIFVLQTCISYSLQILIIGCFFFFFKISFYSLFLQIPSLPFFFILFRYSSFPLDSASNISCSSVNLFIFKSEMLELLLLSHFSRV